MKYILVNNNFIIQSKEDKLDYTLNLLKLAGADATKDNIIIFDTIEEAQSYVRMNYPFKIAEVIEDD